MWEDAMVGQAVVHLGCEPVNDYMAAPATHLVGLRARIRICRLPAAPSSLRVRWLVKGAESAVFRY